jgi:predicted SAM-dependent methyltransferase
MNDALPTTTESPAAAAQGSARSTRLRQWLRAHAVTPASAVLSRLGLLVSREDVVWCYRHLLGREPESEQAVLAHLHVRSFRALAEQFVQSAEFAGLHAPVDTRRPQGGRGPRVDRDAFRRTIDEFLQREPPSHDREVYIDTHFDRLLHTLNTVAELLPEQGRLVDYSAAAFFGHALAQLRPGVEQTSVTGVNFERDKYVVRFGHERFDFCLNTEVLEHLLYDPAHMAFAINRLLKPGGQLFLTTPNAISLVNALRLMNGYAPTLWNQVKPDQPYYERHNREWTPFEVARLLEEHGFEVLETYTEDFYATTRQMLARHRDHGDYLRRHSSHQYHGDTICVVARKKVRAPKPVRNPWLYAFHERG